LKKGIGTKESVLLELLCTKEDEEIEKLKLAYKKVTGDDLEKELRSEARGDFERVLRSLVAGQRPSTQHVDADLANKEAQELYDVKYI
jgi:hypothetical protein